MVKCLTTADGVSSHGLELVAGGEHGSQAQDQRGVDGEGVAQVYGEHQPLQPIPEGNRYNTLNTHTHTHTHAITHLTHTTGRHQLEAKTSAVMGLFSSGGRTLMGPKKPPDEVDQSPQWTVPTGHASGWTCPLVMSLG